jgi:glutathione S-transferase
MFLAEKGLDIPYERLEIDKENRTEAFREKNPLSTLPVLELDDGRCLSESIAICRYFEAAPEPALFGRTPFEQGERRRTQWLRDSRQLPEPGGVAPSRFASSERKA